MSQAVYTKASKVAGGCAIEAGLLLKLADNECKHGRLPGDRTEPCGCWSTVTLLDVFSMSRRAKIAERRARVAELYEAGVPMKGIAMQIGATLGAVKSDVDQLHYRGLVARRYRPKQEGAAA